MKPGWIAFLALAGSAVLYAQTPNRVTADIPFAFEMSNKKFPAGEYIVNDTNNVGHVVLVRSKEGDIGAMAFSSHVIEYASGEGTQMRLVFNKYGDRHFLSQVWYSTISLQLPKSRNEKTLVTSTFITSAPTKVVIVARAF